MVLDTVGVAVETTVESQLSAAGSRGISERVGGKPSLIVCRRKAGANADRAVASLVPVASLKDKVLLARALLP
jgi:hypothetical protein